MEQSSGQSLQGKRIAVLMTDGVEQVEYTGPRSFRPRVPARTSRDSTI
jgi:protease I